MNSVQNNENENEKAICSIIYQYIALCYYLHEFTLITSIKQDFLQRIVA